MVIFFWMRSCLQPTFHPFSPPEFSVMLFDTNSCFLFFSLFLPESLTTMHFSNTHRSCILGFLLLVFSVPAHLEVAERSGISAFRQGITSPSPSSGRSRETSLLTLVQYMSPSSAELYYGPCLSSSCVLSPLLNIHMFMPGWTCII